MSNVVALRAAPKSMHPMLSEEILTVARCLSRLAEDANRSDLPLLHRAALMSSLSQAAWALQDAADALGQGVMAALTPHVRS